MGIIRARRIGIFNSTVLEPFLNYASTENGALIGVTPANGGSTTDAYFGPSAYSLSMATGSGYTAVGAIFTNTSNTNSILRSSKSSSSGSTFRGGGSSGSPFSIVIDLGVTRTFTKARYYQMFADGKTTHAALDGSSTLQTRTGSWTQIHDFTLLDNDVNSSGVEAAFAAVTYRYVRVRLYNDGRYGSSSYTELYNVKIFPT